MLVRAVDEQSLLDDMCAAIVEAGGYLLAWYGRPLSDPARSVEIVSTAGPAVGYLDQVSISWGDDAFGQGPTGTCIRTRTTQVRNNLASDPHYSPWREAAREWGLQCSISLPVLVEGDLDGALMVYAGESHTFDQQAEALLTDLAADLGFGLSRLREAVALAVARTEAITRGQQLQATLDAQTDPCVLLGVARDAHGQVTALVVEAANNAAAAHHDLTREEFLGHHYLEGESTMWGCSSAELVTRVVERQETFTLDGFAVLDHATAHIRRFDITAVAAANGVVVTWRDVTKVLNETAALADSERRYRLLADNATDVILEADHRGRFVWASESITAVLGWKPQEVIGLSAVELIDEADRERALTAQHQVIPGNTAEIEVRMRCRDGSSKWMVITAKGVAGPEGIHRIASLRDIDAEVMARAELAHAMGHDPLTGVAARPVVMRHIEHRLSALKPTATVGVLCVGVDSLRSINDALTHAAGDLLLTTVAARIAESAGDDAVIGRGTGDEFVVFIPHLDNEAEAGAAADAIRAAVFQPTVVLGRPIEPTVSVGIASGGPGDSAQQLVRDASLAMRLAKLNGRNRCEYADPALAQSAQHRLTMVANMRDALAAGEFIPFFQPIVAFDVPGSAVGYEALVRWLQPDGTIVMPIDFLPVAERSALMPDLDAAVLRSAVATLATLPTPTFMSVNMSSASLMKTDWADVIQDALAAHGIPGNRLHLEITETSMLEVAAGTVANMERLAVSGARWYVDDFGTGYSSISHLRDLPISGLKLDLTFTRGIRQGDQTSLQLARALAGLADGLGLDTIAEGVETEVEARTLTSQGWQRGQGWLYGRPAPAPSAPLTSDG